LKGARSLEDLPKPREMSASEVKSFAGLVLDVRTSDEFGAGHIPDALNIGLGGQFASWAGTLIPIGTPIVIAADTEAQVDEAFTRLARVGIETINGFIFLKNWTFQGAKIEQISVNEMSKLAQTDKEIQFVDVRRVAEYINGHAPQTLNIPLNKLAQETGKLDKSRPVHVICQGGYRSSAGASILERAGFEKIYNVTGGTAAWIEAALKTEKAETLSAA
jgi:hydroxyacylglutathione hydrolase